MTPGTWGRSLRSTHLRRSRWTGRSCADVARRRQEAGAQAHTHTHNQNGKLGTAMHTTKTYAHAHVALPTTGPGSRAQTSHAQTTAPRDREGVRERDKANAHQRGGHSRGVGPHARTAPHTTHPQPQHPPTHNQTTSTRRKRRGKKRALPANPARTRGAVPVGWRPRGQPQLNKRHVPQPPPPPRTCT
jgi:hypothetical protein